MNLETKVPFLISRFLTTKINLVFFFFIKSSTVVESTLSLISTEHYNEKINELHERERSFMVVSALINIK